MWLIDQMYIKLGFQAYNKEIGKFFFILRLGRQKKSRLFALIQAENKQEMSERYGNQVLKQAGHNFAETFIVSHYNLKTTSIRFQRIFFLLKKIFCDVIKLQNFIQILSRFYPDFFRNSLYLGFIQIFEKSG